MQSAREGEEAKGFGGKVAKEEGGGRRHRRREEGGGERGGGLDPRQRKRRDHEAARGWEAREYEAA